MRFEFLYLPPELRLILYIHLTALRTRRVDDNLPGISAYGGLRGSCHFIKNEFDHEIMPLLRTYHQDIIARTIPVTDTGLVLTLPATFDESRTLKLSLTLSHLEDYYHSIFEEWPAKLLLRKLHQHIRALRIDIHFLNVPDLEHLRRDILAALFNTIDQEVVKARKVLRLGMLPKTQIKSVEVTWKNGWSQERRIAFGESVKEASWRYALEFLEESGTREDMGFAYGVRWDIKGRDKVVKKIAERE
ncbi:hypothetical protein EJ02DRAFT_419540 [Clathrospora elynae]|uniref:Uncharacterized protein n=1 Tax=Clathrospora elynae TaxID=706981 RepID=A0A6A5T0W0_9PLEO|nr:hypothetical protein EJ02DRAFT_419540 [Clathrospora elynae]